MLIVCPIPPAPPGPHLVGGGHIKLRLGLGADHRPDIAPVQNRAPPTPGKGALEIHERRAHLGHQGLELLEVAADDAAALPEVLAERLAFPLTGLDQGSQGGIHLRDQRIPLGLVGLLVGGEQPAGRVFPSDQRLHAQNGTGAELDDRLVVGAQLAPPYLTKLIADEVIVGGARERLRVPEQHRRGVHRGGE